MVLLMNLNSAIILFPIFVIQIMAFPFSSLIILPFLNYLPFSNECSSSFSSFLLSRSNKRYHLPVNHSLFLSFVSHCHSLTFVSREEKCQTFKENSSLSLSFLSFFSFSFFLLLFFLFFILSSLAFIPYHH